MHLAFGDWKSFDCVVRNINRSKTNCRHESGGDKIRLLFLPTFAEHMRFTLCIYVSITKTKLYWNSELFNRK